MTAKAIIAKLEATLTPLGAFRSRPMFGGHGLYLDDLFFGLIAYDKVYLKTDEQNRGDYVKAKSKPFSFESSRKGLVTTCTGNAPPTSSRTAASCGDGSARLSMPRGAKRRRSRNALCASRRIF